MVAGVEGEEDTDDKPHNNDGNASAGRRSRDGDDDDDATVGDYTGFCCGGREKNEKV